VFKLALNGIDWMPSVPSSFYGVLHFAFVPSLQCRLEVKGGKARINHGAWYVLPALVVEGDNQLAIESHYEGVFDVVFTDHSSIFSDMSAADNEVGLQQTATVDFTNLSQTLSATVDILTVSKTTTATIAATPTTAVAAPMATVSFNINRTPNTPIYWGDMRDGGAFALQVIYA